MESFGRGFDRLVRLGPQEIQVGILKRLRGTPIVRHDEEHRMIYAPEPPYEILATSEIPFAEMQRLRRFARYWDLVANSGHFTATLQLLWLDDGLPFAGFLAFSDWLHARLRRTHQIALHVMAQALFDFLVGEKARDAAVAAATIGSDWHRAPGREALNLRGLRSTRADGAPMSARAAGLRAEPKSKTKRQTRHLSPGEA